MARHSPIQLNSQIHTKNYDPGQSNYTIREEGKKKKDKHYLENSVKSDQARLVFLKKK